eukprot:285627-Amphidinium_carterae.1
MDQRSRLLLIKKVLWFGGRVVEPSPDQMLDKLIASKTARDRTETFRNCRIPLPAQRFIVFAPIQPAAAPPAHAGLPQEWKDDILRSLGSYSRNMRKRLPRSISPMGHWQNVYGCWNRRSANLPPPAEVLLRS